MIFRRDWQLIDKTVLPSGYEQMAAHGETPTRYSGSGFIFQKTVVLTFKCQRTGRIKVVREHNL